MSLIKAVFPRKGDVVKIKFKPIADLIRDLGTTLSEADSNLDLSENFKAMIHGGHFLVEAEMTEDTRESAYGNYFAVNNHIDYNCNFTIYDAMIESIEAIEVEEKFVSPEHNLIVLRLDDELFINGVSLLGNEERERKRKEAPHKAGLILSKKKSEEPTDYVNPARKLLTILENYIGDLAVQDTLGGQK
jgi:hypothetical protein